MAKRYASAQEELDNLFIDLLENFSKSIIAHANQSAEFILLISGNFLNETVQKALIEFHGLYFSSGNQLDSAAESVNHEIDSMVENMQAMMLKGEEIKEDLLPEKIELKDERLSLAGLQKKLEKIITLDSNIKEVLVPVLSSMQFEDMLTHRLLHVVMAWKAVVVSRMDNIDLNTTVIAESIAGMLTSQLERKQFYELVLKIKAPDDFRDQESLIDILFDTSAESENKK